MVKMAQKRSRKNSRKKTKKTPVHGHIVNSLLQVAAHKHTGKKLHHSHTSYGGLVLFMLLAGAVLLLSMGSLNALGVTSSGNVNVSLTVPSEPPSVGAQIVNPQNGDTVTNDTINVSGTCPEGTTVVIYRNGIFAASSMCSTEGQFLATVQLRAGDNLLQAQNYDSLDQAGPATPTVLVRFDAVLVDGIPDSQSQESIVVVDIPEPVPTSELDLSELTCNTIGLGHQSVDALLLEVGCVTRQVYTGEVFNLPVYISGGEPPYALSISWDDTNQNSLYTVTEQGRMSFSNIYDRWKTYTLRLNIADSKGRTYATQVVVQVIDATAAAAGNGNSLTPYVPVTLQKLWLEASVPTYIAVSTLVLGFWVGDIFQRVFGIKKMIHPRKTK